MPKNLPEVRASHADRDRVVEILRVAGGEGRLTSEELDTRLGSALMAQTIAELEAIVADLPAPVAMKDLVVIEQSGGKYVRDGRWVVPSRIRLKTETCRTTLDFTEALIMSDVLHIDADLNFGRLRIISAPGIVIDADGVRLKYSKVKLQPRDTAAYPRLKIIINGKLRHAKLVEKRR